MLDTEVPTDSKSSLIWDRLRLPLLPNLLCELLYTPSDCRNCPGCCILLWHNAFLAIQVDIAVRAGGGVIATTYPQLIQSALAKNMEVACSKVLIPSLAQDLNVVGMITRHVT